MTGGNARSLPSLKVGSKDPDIWLESMGSPLFFFDALLLVDVLHPALRLLLQLSETEVPQCGESAYQLCDLEKTLGPQVLLS
jgi:hypothetical protein